MSKNRIKLIIILFLAVTLIPVILPQPEALAVGESGFVVDIAVVDDSCGEHVSNIRMPQAAIKFRLSPEVTRLPEDNRYNRLRGNFPEGNATQDTKVIEFEIISDIVTSDKDGINPLFVKLSDINELKKGTAVWGQSGKVYRYNIEIVGIYRTDNDATNPDVDRSINYLNGGDYFSGPNNPVILGDIYIDHAGEIDTAVFWDATGNEKCEGFVKTGSDASGCVKYHVLDFEFSTDYIGRYANSIAGKITYSVNFEYIPDFLTDNYSYFGGNNIRSAIADKNKDSWNVYTMWPDPDKPYTFDAYDPANPPAVPSFMEVGVVLAGGALSNNDEILFTGFPYEGKDGHQISFIFGLAGKMETVEGTNLSLVYEDYLYRAVNADRIKPEVKSYTNFINSGYTRIYEKMPLFSYSSQITGHQINILSVSYGDLTRYTIGGDDGDKTYNARIVIFDPDELVIVGITLNVLPGVIAVLISVSVVATIVIIARKRIRQGFN